MRNDWTETTLGDVADVNMGQSPPGDTYNSEGVGMPFMQGSAEFGEHYPEPVKFCSAPAKIAEIGDLLLSVRAPVGDSNFANKRIAIGRGLATVRAKRGADTNFLRLVIQLNTAGLLATSGTGMFSSITGKNLREFGVNLPPLAEQKRIVDVVSSVDSYIDALQQNADTARTARKAIEVAEFDNPENELSVLGDYCDKNDIQVGPFGSQLHQHEYVADGIPVVMPKNIVDGRISEKNIARITPEKASELKRHILMPGDVLFARRGDLSKRALVTEAQAGWLCGTGTVRVRSKKLDAAILFRLTNTSDVNTWLIDNSVGATMPNLNTAIVASIPLRVPENALEAVALLRGMDEYLDGLTNSIRSAMELRSGLLSDLLSGEHEIPKAYDRFLRAA